MADSDLIVVWGGNPVSTQVNVMTHVATGPQGARRQARRGRPLSHADRRGRPTCIWCCGPAPTARWRCAVMHVLFDGRPCRSRLPRALHRRRRRARGASRDPHAGVGGAHHRPAGARDRGLRPPLRRAPSAASCALGFGFTRTRNGAASMHAVSCLPAITGAWAARGRRRVLPQLDNCDSSTRPLIAGPRRARPRDPHARPVAHRADPVRRRGRLAAARRSRRC